LYIFFDYKDVQNQTAEKVIASLLKQLIFSIKTIPSTLQRMYNEAKSGSPRPILSDFVDIFIAQAKSASFVVLFDAFDECQQQGIVCSQIIQKMYASKIKISITHRPHVLQSPEFDFKEFTKMEIRAQGEDIENYISRQLEIEERAKRLTEIFKTVIIKEIKDQANGM
jgi:hypothetical protein